MNNISFFVRVGLLFFCLYVAQLYSKIFQCFKEDWSGRCTTSCGTSGTGETPQAKPRRLTARPAESNTWSGNPLF
ncbi:hypothetical protein FZC80_02500 [Rossellomorea aquimaris]|uniref:Uncharacterized protein n=1 Tax=Rossellomorea aquimaris TaxID=189382 RepID=A0A5D4U7R8_9BACI|nr:hypothetical protein FZC80_02500 [Rossellomorea aquimaris]